MFLTVQVLRKAIFYRAQLFVSLVIHFTPDPTRLSHILRVLLWVMLVVVSRGQDLSLFSYIIHEVESKCYQTCFRRPMQFFVLDTHLK